MIMSEENGWFYVYERREREGCMFMSERYERAVGDD